MNSEHACEDGGQGSPGSTALKQLLPMFRSTLMTDAPVAVMPPPEISPSIDIVLEQCKTRAPVPSFTTGMSSPVSSLVAFAASARSVA